jgi:glycosyltransferase involved in cell wall biosynthesis
MDSISVIIPIYNNREYLNQCLTSVKNQTHVDLEIICIDDGSTDGAQDIVDEYASCDERFIVIHEDNQGESHARNVGLDMATGDYIAFVDCDDWIEPDMYEILLSAVKKTSAQMSVASWFKDNAQNSEPIQNIKPVKEGIFHRDDLMRYIYIRDVYKSFAYMWDKLYKKELLKRPDGTLIRFDESMPLGGDVLFLSEITLNTQSAVYTDKCLYHYRQQEVSGCHTRDLERLRSWIRSYEMVIDLYEKNQINKEVMDYLKRFLAYHSSNAAEEAIKQENYKKKTEFQSFMKKYHAEYLELNRDHAERIERYERILRL